ncbi:hypothetical protein D3C81_1666750 [compost metagenome]
MASCSTGKVTSSMITVVPVLRTAPTAGKVSLRMAQRRAFSCGSSVKSTCFSTGNALSDAMICASCSCSKVDDAARDSISKAQALFDRCCTKAGMPGLFCTERRLRRSSSSTADTGWLFSTDTALQQVSTSGNTIRAEALFGWSITVS